MSIWIVLLTWTAMGLAVAMAFGALCDATSAEPGRARKKPPHSKGAGAETAGDFVTQT